MATLGELIWISVRPVLKIFIASAGGALMARAGILDGMGLKLISKVIVNFLSPSLLFSKTVAGISLENIEDVGVIALIAIFYLVMGFLLGCLIRRFCRLPGNFSYAVIAVSTWGNWGDIPIAVLMSLGESPPFRKGDSDTGVAYASVVLAVFNLTLWGAGYKLFQWDFAKVSQKESSPPEDKSSTLETNDMESHSVQEEEEVITVISLDTKPQKLPSELEFSKTFPKKEMITPDTNRIRLVGKRFRRLREQLGNAFNPPNIALLVGLIVALIPQLRALFVVTPNNSSPPLSFLKDTADSIGMAAVPMGLICLGGGLARLSFKSVSPKVIVLLVVSKLILLPMAGIGMNFALTYAAHLINPEDKILRFVVLFIGCVPTASSCVVLTQLYSPDGESREIGSVLLVMYLVSLLTMTAFLTFYLHVLG
ncbi:uncharacterized protein VTP21DRAFT_6166 [Calcarisporiella thermophila]|uniref:uncharacterized protein n=1 Tax=Calcarisporiella thermophila TaxID=911321 RepID=UPI0037432B69